MPKNKNSEPKETFCTTSLQTCQLFRKSSNLINSMFGVNNVGKVFLQRDLFKMFDFAKFRSFFINLTSLGNV